MRRRTRNARTRATAGEYPCQKELGLPTGRFDMAIIVAILRLERRGEEDTSVAAIEEEGKEVLPEWQINGRVKMPRHEWIDEVCKHCKAEEASAPSNCFKPLRGKWTYGILFHACARMVRSGYLEERKTDDGKPSMVKGDLGPSAFTYTLSEACREQVGAIVIEAAKNFKCLYPAKKKLA